MGPSGGKTAPAAKQGEHAMAWTRPTIREICIGMEINGYMPSEI
jgi:coenzyme PQQ precursor peptide PqqA